MDLMIVVTWIHWSLGARAWFSLPCRFSYWGSRSKHSEGDLPLGYLWWLRTSEAISSHISVMGSQVTENLSEIPSSVWSFQLIIIWLAIICLHSITGKKKSQHKQAVSSKSLHPFGKAKTTFKLNPWGTGWGGHCSFVWFQGKMCLEIQKN